MNKLPETNILYLDFETTGLESRLDDVIEIAARKVTHETNDFHVFVKTDKVIQEGAFEAHGISKEFLEEHGLDQESAWNQFYSFIGDARYLIAHNGVKFDFKFLEHNLNKRNLKLPGVVKYIDTAMICKGKFLVGNSLAPKVDSLTHLRACVKIGEVRALGVKYNLAYSCRRYGIAVDDKRLHGAFNDMDLLASLYSHIRDRENYDYNEGDVNISDYGYSGW